jgi:hypothetical protein
MPDDTTILSLPLILPAQAQKHVTHNEALVKLDLMVQLAVINRTLTTAPALPVIGDRHIVATGATGAWVGQSGRIAMYTQAGWQFTQPLPGWQAYVMAESQMAFFNGLGWIALSDGPFTVGRLGVSATPDATNRLAVSSPATLLNHAGSGHQLKLNKAVMSDTASLLFQTGFGGRAEMGTSGSDDFAVKVSADGATWSVALEADAATGEMTLPQPVHLGGQAADPGAPVDGTLWLNTTTGEVKVRSAGVTQVIGGGGGVTDGDKGDITVSGAGTSWTIDAGAVSLGKLADIATDSFLGRDTAGTGAPEVLTAAQARGILNVADGATANALDAALRDRASHTGTQGAATITGLAGIATSGSASDLVAGVLPAARFDDTAHGARAGGGLHAVATGAAAGFMAAADKTKLDAISGTNTGDQTITLSGDVTGAGTGSFAATIAGNAVTNAKLADVASGTIKGRATAGAGDPEDLTGVQATALLDVFGAAAKGLAPASGGGTANFLRADGTWAAPSGGGGAPGGTNGELQYNNGGVLAGAPDVEIEGGQLRLPSISTPTTPASGGLKLYGQDVAGRILPVILGPSGLEMALQPHLGGNRVARWTPSSNSTTATLDGFPTVAAQGTATAFSWAATSRRTRMAMIEYLNGTASTTAIAGLRTSVARWTVGAATAGDGGFHLLCTWGTATGIAATSATHRGFCGLRTGTPADANPSSLASIVGMGWDSADANLQFMHNDGSGTATKIDLGTGFPRPTADRGDVYELALFSPPGTTQMVGYRVRNLMTGAAASGVVTTNLPAATLGLGWGCHVSAGGTSSIIGAAVMGVYVETDF